MSELKLTTLDPNQISRYSYDEDTRSMRVSFVGIAPTIDLAQDFRHPDPTIIEKPIYIDREKLVQVEVPKIITEIQYREIEKPVYIERIKEVLVPQIVEKIVYREIEKPVIIEREKVIYSDSVVFPNWLKYCMIIQNLLMVGLLIFKH
jgi:hypothetical protein